MENNEGGEEEANDERRSPLRASEKEFYLQNEILRDCFIRYPLFHGII